MKYCKMSTFTVTLEMPSVEGFGVYSYVPFSEMFAVISLNIGWGTFILIVALDIPL